MDKPSQTYSTCDMLQGLHQLGPAYISKEVTQVVNSYLRPQEGKHKLHTHTHTDSRGDVYPCRQSVETDSLPLPVPVSPHPVRQDRPHLRYNICYAQEGPFSNIFSLLAEKGTRGFWSQRDAF